MLQHDPLEGYTAPQLQNTPVKIAQSCETIHPGTKEGTVQKGQKPKPTHRSSEGPLHNLEETVSTVQQIRMDKTLKQVTTKRRHKLTSDSKLQRK